MLENLKKVFDDKNLKEWHFGPEYKEIQDFAKLVGEELILNTKTLVLNFNFQFGEEGVKYISKGLKLNTSLTRLHLDLNELGDESIKHLSEALKFNTSLNGLYLNSNKFGDEGAKYILEALKLNISLNLLDLSSNKIGDEGVKHISETLKLNTSLNTLDLSSNNIGNKGAKYISEGLKLNASLVNLDLHLNNIEDEGAKYISEALNFNFFLMRLYLNLNYISEEGIKFISETSKFIYCDILNDNNSKLIQNIKTKIKNKENLGEYFKKLKLNDKLIIQLNSLSFMYLVEIILEKDYQNENEVKNLIEFFQNKVNEWNKGGNIHILNSFLLRNTKYFKTIEFQKQHSDQALKPFLTMIYNENIEFYSKYINEIKSRFEIMKKFALIPSEQETLQNIIGKYILEWKEQNLHEEEMNIIIRCMKVDLKTLLEWKYEVGFKWEMIPEMKEYFDELNKYKFMDLIKENGEKAFKIKELTKEKESIYSVIEKKDEKIEELMKKIRELENKLSTEKITIENPNLNGLLFEDIKEDQKK